MSVVFLGIGSNQGDRLLQLIEAFKAIEIKIGLVKDFSAVYQTEPLGFHSTSVFYNQVLKVETKINPAKTLSELLKIETMLGRVRTTSGYADRLIDIDILLFDNKIINTKSLKIPHPNMFNRRFVMLPLVTIASDVIHPVEKLSIQELNGKCMDHSEVKLIFSKVDFANRLSQSDLTAI